MKKNMFIGWLLLSSAAAYSQTGVHPEIPAVLDGLSYNADGKLATTKSGQNYVDPVRKDAYLLSRMSANPAGTETGILIDLQWPGFNGTVAYGPYDETSEYPTVAFLPKDVKMTDGRALLECKKTFTKSNDFFKLDEKGKGVIGYRILDSVGKIIYEGRVAFRGNGPYEVLPTLILGPMINNLASDSCIISYETQVPVMTSVVIDGRTFADAVAGKHHELTIKGLRSGTDYTYSVLYGDRSDAHKFTTAPAAGARKPFTFAFASANRATTGGGERDFGGTNYQSTRAVMAAAVWNNAAFMQATGDITLGANLAGDAHLMEYANFKRAMEPFWLKIPVYVGFGDHEVNKISLMDPAGIRKAKSVESFPYATESGEATFAKAFVNPPNGPESEDGASYDPHPGQADFPTYKENVYYYTYDNVAMIVLNTEYWESKDPLVTSGCPEGYIMDQQVQWLKTTLVKMESDPNIDHIFVNIHGAAFPNGDHLADAMWWNGDNTSRAVVAGKLLQKGTIERRDEILDLCVNKSKKFLSFLSGDEHNFSFLEVTPETAIYTDSYKGARIKLSRSFYNINNGGGGSAPYAMLSSPWSGGYRYFTEPPVLALINVNGKHVSLKALRVETLSPICSDVKLR